MTKFDIKNYFEKIYNIDVAKVNTRIQLGKCSVINRKWIAKIPLLCSYNPYQFSRSLNFCSTSYFLQPLPVLAVIGINFLLLQYCVSTGKTKLVAGKVKKKEPDYKVAYLTLVRP